MSQAGAIDSPSEDSSSESGLDRSVTRLPGIGDKGAEKLARIGVRTIRDLIFHLPTRYQDRTRITPIGSLRQGEEAVVVGRIEISQIAYGRRRSLVCRLSDNTGLLTIRLFHFSPNQKNSLARGRWIICFGEIRSGPNGIELVHPEYKVFERRPEAPEADTLTAVYRSVEGISQPQLRKLIGRAIDEEVESLVDFIPEQERKRLQMPSLIDAVRLLHQPPPSADLDAVLASSHPAQRRLAFEELLAHHLSLRKMRLDRDDGEAPVMKHDGNLLQRFIDHLDFDPTAAQDRVIGEVVRDLASDRPCLRLIQGDVGSGKTVVAAAAACYAIEAGWQVAVMAPTELLAEQHFRSFDEWLSPLEVKVTALTGRLPAATRRRALTDIADGSAGVVVGTHALFQDGVEFNRLGLVIVDEQHRFGVDQRLALREKGVDSSTAPHQLTMTATPIPRTMAMVFYADIDVSSIDELPPGRQAIETVVVPDSRRAEILKRVQQACNDGHQAYWVCPLIDESESLDAQAATETERSFRSAFPDLSIGLVHGRMKSAEKDAVMEQFRSNQIQLLVATTVIEVGVDVPNAGLMIIENAERLGLSQLHQLRGRVGRGSQKSACVLLYRGPLSPTARKRLSIMRDTTDGFEISRHDLEHRGPGEVLGTRQTGLAEMKVANLGRDHDMLEDVEKTGSLLINEQPDNIDRLIARWIGDATAYGNV